MPRLFIAIDLPKEIKEGVSRFYSSILRPEGAVHTCEAEYFLST